MIQLQIATPVYQGVQPATVDCILECMYHCLRHGMMVKWDHVEYTAIEYARAELVGRMLSSPATHLLFLDSDNAIPPDVLQRMIETDLDIVSVICPLRQQPEKLNLLSSKGGTRSAMTMANGHRVFEIEASGLACVLIQRRVLERLYELHSSLIYKSAQSGDRLHCALFNHIVRDGIYHGEDASFFVRARAAGFRPFALYDAPIRHDTIAFNFAEYHEGKMLEEAQSQAAAE